MYKHFYTKFLQANSSVTHMAAHSHHYWPDCTRDAQLLYWDDSAKHVDDKWDYFFGVKIKKLQKYIAKEIGISKPEQITIAPNTHELLYRVLSCLDWNKKQKVLTTDSEFHSFNRQINRLNEMENFEIHKVSVEPIDTFKERFIEAAKSFKPDLTFFSQVFFNSGYSINEHLEEIVSALENIIVIDGYHGYFAIPTDLSKIESKIFYLSGSYKYAQGGEGLCFLYSPAGNNYRPVYTGWFADFAGLSNASDKVGYSDDGMKFAGSTIDMTPVYRALSVFDLYEKHDLNTTKVHDYIKSLQNDFIDKIKALNHSDLNIENLMLSNQKDHGHFLTFQLDSVEKTKHYHDELKAHGILTDFRKNKLRFGFGLYLEKDDIDLDCLNKIKEC